MMNPLINHRILLGLTGGVACYKAAHLCRLLVKQQANVQVVMTDAACHFITPVTMQALSNQIVYCDAWDARIANNMAHIELSRQAQTILIAPASADFIAKLAHGQADDLLTSLCLARPSSIRLLVAPAMNVEMWDNPATVRNIKQIQADGITVLGPFSGEQACGEVGMGRMLEPEWLVAELLKVATYPVLNKKRVLVTAGATFEPIDPVRGLTNLSSGKMGYAVAQAAFEAGAEVHLITANSTLPLPYGCAYSHVQTAQQLYDGVLDRVNDYDIFISVAAVADWRVDSVASHKYKKQNNSIPTLHLVTNPDILATVAALKRAPFCVGFAAESENILTYGAAKRVQKNVPLLVGNIGPDTFGQDDNSIILFDQNGHYAIPPADKLTLARYLMTAIGERLQ